MILPRTRLVLPTVYDECLSYYEQLRKLTECIKALAEDLESGENDILDNAKKYTDSKFSKVENDFTDFKVYVELQNKTFYDSVNQKLAENKNLLDSQIQEIRAEINYFMDLVHLEFVRLDKSVNDLYIGIVKINESEKKRFDEIEKRLLKIIENSISAKNGNYIIVRNPITGKIEKLNDVLQQFYNFYIVIGGITAKQYDDMEIRALEFDNEKITASQFDTKAYFLFFDRVKLNPVYQTITAVKKGLENKLLVVENKSYMLSPFDGIKTLISDVVQKLSNFHKNYLSASEYDAKNLTASEYDNMQLTAYNYDWNAKNLIN